MRVTEPQLRAVLLAQAIERIDTGRTLVSQTEWDDATRSAVAAARQRGVQRVGAGDVLLERAHTIAARAIGRDTTVAALRGSGAHWRWLARGLPLVALLMGLAVDRIANAHRVDLLSPPLLIVLAWNLCVYLLIALRAWRTPRAHPQSGPGAWLQGLHFFSRPGRLDFTVRALHPRQTHRGNGHWHGHFLPHHGGGGAAVFHVHCDPLAQFDALKLIRVRAVSALGPRPRIGVIVKHARHPLFRENT